MLKKYFLLGLLLPLNLLAQVIPSDSEIKTRLEAKENSVPLTFNPLCKPLVVEYAANYSNKTGKILERFNRLNNDLVVIFERNKVPVELRYMCIALSNCDNSFSESNGREGCFSLDYIVANDNDLYISNFIDERRDPLKAAEVFCKQISDIYAKCGDWRIAITQYSCGKLEWERAVVSNPGPMSDYWSIANNLNYTHRMAYPRFLAAVYIANYYGLHNIQGNGLVLKTESVPIRQYATLFQLAHSLDVSYDLLKELNPIYKKGIIPNSGRDYYLVLPAKKVHKFYDLGDDVYETKEEKVVNTIVSQTKVIEYNANNTVPIVKEASRTVVAGNVPLEIKPLKVDTAVEISDIPKITKGDTAIVVKEIGQEDTVLVEDTDVNAILLTKIEKNSEIDTVLLIKETPIAEKNVKEDSLLVTKEIPKIENLSKADTIGIAKSRDKKRKAVKADKGSVAKSKGKKSKVVKADTLVVATNISKLENSVNVDTAVAKEVPKTSNMTKADSIRLAKSIAKKSKVVHADTATEVANLPNVKSTLEVDTEVVVTNMAKEADIVKEDTAAIIEESQIAGQTILADTLVATKEIAKQEPPIKIDTAIFSDLNPEIDEPQKSDTTVVMNYISTGEESITYTLDTVLLEIIANETSANNTIDQEIIPKVDSNSFVASTDAPIIQESWQELEDFVSASEELVNTEEEPIVSETVLPQKDTLKNEPIKTQAKNEIKGDKTLIYVVRKGDAISIIADYYDCYVSDIKRWNNLHSTRINYGQKLMMVIPAEKYDYYIRINKMSVAELNEIRNRD